MLRLLVLVAHREAVVEHPVVLELERRAVLELAHPVVPELERPAAVLAGAQVLEQVPGLEPALAQEAAAQR
jgi:hypothetical protein